MIRHVVMMKWNDQATPDGVGAFHAALTALVDSIPEIGSYTAGPDIGVFKANQDYALVADFASVDDFKTYVFHEAHQAAIAEFGASITESSVTAQFNL